MKVPYHPTPPERARELLELAGLAEGELLVDLGCGEGNVIITAAEEFGARAVGIEIDPALVERARRRVKELGLEQVQVIQGDLFSPRFWRHLGGSAEFAVAEADVVAIYLNFEAHRLLKPMLERELKEGARVASYEFFVYGWKPVREKPMMFVFRKGESF